MKEGTVRDSEVVSPATSSEKIADPALVLRGITKRYPGVVALNDVSVEIFPGAVHALVGENGAGKSTLVAIASGAVTPDSGLIEISGESPEEVSPTWALENGLAIVHQEPALLPDLTVSENMWIAVPDRMKPSIRDQKSWAEPFLARWKAVATVSPASYVRDLKPNERFVVEFARVLASDPRILILDEPTEHLLEHGVEILFQAIRDAVERGVAVIYISHRIREVKSIADTISVLRNGELVATNNALSLSEDEIVQQIIGRRLGARFPAKGSGTQDAVGVSAQGFDGRGFDPINLDLMRGEILGLAGIEGQGQRALMHALAGISRARGRVTVAGRVVKLTSTAAASNSGIAYLSNDRHREGMLPDLTVRENLNLRRLKQLAFAGIIRGRRESAETIQAINRFGIKTASPESIINTLSGGNQQKVMIGRVLASDANILLVDEPSQGVDVGARAEIYGLLREAADEGKAVCVLSSDNSELEGLCDRVLVFSRGKMVKELTGEAVTERAITTSAVTTTSERTQSRSARGGLGRFASSNLAPLVVLMIAILGLGLITTLNNSFYLTPRNFALLLPLLAVIGFAAIAQQFAMLVGGIDLSIGPLMSMTVATASFVLTPLHTLLGLGFGWLILLAIGLAVGVVNYFLIDRLGVGPIIATLVTFMALQGLALMVRPTPGGQFNTGVLQFTTAKIGFFPVSVIVVSVVAVALEWMLYRTPVGVRLRASGSNPDTASALGISVWKIRMLAYAASSVFAVVAATYYFATSGSGNATVANGYTLSSIGAVVIGGASLFGGRGSFIGALLGAALILQVNTVVSFLGMTDFWQQILLGSLTIVAVAFYSKARARPGVGM